MCRKDRSTSEGLSHNGRDHTMTSERKEGHQWGGYGTRKDVKTVDHYSSEREERSNDRYRCESLHCHVEWRVCIAASPHASYSSWKYPYVLRHCASSILIQERCSSFVDMVKGARTIPMKVNVLHTAVDWQSTVAAGCTNSSNSPRSYPQS